MKKVAIAVALAATMGMSAAAAMAATSPKTIFSFQAAKWYSYPTNGVTTWAPMNVNVALIQQSSVLASGVIEGNSKKNKLTLSSNVTGSVQVQVSYSQSSDSLSTGASPQVFCYNNTFDMNGNSQSLLIGPPTNSSYGGTPDNNFTKGPCK